MFIYIVVMIMRLQPSTADVVIRAQRLCRACPRELCPSLRDGFGGEILVRVEDVFRVERGLYPRHQPHRDCGLGVTCRQHSNNHGHTETDYDGKEGEVMRLGME